VRTIGKTRFAQQARERLVEGGLAATAGVSAAAVAALFLFLAYFAAPLFLEGQLGAVFSLRWRPFQGEFGVGAMIAGSLFVSLGALLLAFPAGVGLCCFIRGLGPRPLALAVGAAARFMASIPTVLYGFVSVFLLVPIFREGFDAGSGFCWLAASMTLALLLTPTIVLLVDAQLQQVEPRYRLTIAALGLSRAQGLLYALLPQCRSGLAAAAALGFGRALGDALISLMLAGNSPRVPHGFFDSARTLTAHIALVVATDSHSGAYRSLFAAGLLLLLTTSGLSALAAMGARLTRGRDERA
jgi:phosphate transport system permease protein